MTAVQAAVLRAHGGDFALERLELADPGPEEVLVRVVATGFCHTDEKVRGGARNVPVPVVLGHEGAGVIEAIGADVTSVAVGDHVVLSFAFCGACPNCRSGHPAYCEQMDDLNFGATGSALNGNEARLHSGFFGQSSFCTHAIVNARSAVRVDPALPLELLGPLGCSIQTGAGAVMNVLRPGPADSLAVWGVGAVGLSAVIAAGWLGCGSIVAIDVNPERLQLARELGATHTVQVDTQRSALGNLHAARAGGVSHAFDTSGNATVLHDAVSGLAPRGTCAFVGGGRAGDQVALEINPLLAGRSLQGVVQGDSIPQQMIPMLADRVGSGELPLARLVSFYPLSEINVAAVDAGAGRAIKPVLRMPSSPIIG